MAQKKKVLILLQLCFALCYLLWVGAQPFVRQAAATKAATLLLSSIRSNPRFEKLPQTQQLELLKGQESLKAGSFQPLVTKYCFSGTGIIWAILSILISLFLLKNNASRGDGVAWCLPVASLIYSFSFSHAPPLRGETLFPSEAEITAEYIAPDEQFKNKQERLIEAWNRYLITKWANQPISTDTVIRAEQLDCAIFNFNLERADWVLNKRGEDAVVAHLLFHPPWVLLIAYFIWNLMFAWRINRFKKLEVRSQKIAKVAT